MTHPSNTPIYTRAIYADDSALVANLEAQIFADAWDERALLEVFAMMGAGGVGAFCDGVLVGYLLYQISDVAQLLRIGVNSKYRRLGIGEQLMHAWLDNLTQLEHDALGALSHAFLEVDAHNRAAITLYQKFDFETIHIRKNYYKTAHGQTDALIMQKALA